MVSVPMLAPLPSLVSFTPKKVLILAPHPDDECIMSGFAVRAKEAFQVSVSVVPFSYGSNKERRMERKAELLNALSVLGFDLLDTRSIESEVDVLTEGEFALALLNFRPDVVIIPHLKDGHPTHILAAELAYREVKRYAKFSGETVHLLQSEFWQSMEKPNLLVPLASQHLVEMGKALLKHIGEVSRNPYHLTLPAWAMDQVRRGSEMREMASGHALAGAPAENAVFGQLYRLETITPGSL